ncbi:hypothetical protein ATCC90586_005782 [Pythium insidiosum]|nr:hypothetical protein ATCC90586_005782 [Pythium insidiosum]
MTADSADRFLFDALAQSQCIDRDAAAAMDVKAVTSDELIVLVRGCLARVLPQDAHADLLGPRSANGQYSAPVGVASRHRVGSQLATALKDLGYTADCGYNHFLYPTEKGTRSILSFLVGKLPRPDSRREDSAATRRHGDSVASVSVAELLVDRSAIGRVFAQWKTRRTLPTLPHRELPVLRGSQALPLQTEPVLLPWADTSAAESGLLFDGLRPGCNAAVSLLERLALAQRTSPLNVDTLDAMDAVESTTLDSFGGRLEVSGTRSAVFVAHDVMMVPKQADDNERSTQLNGDEEEEEEHGDGDGEQEGLAQLPFFVSAANALLENQQDAIAKSSSLESPPIESQLLETSKQDQLEELHAKLQDKQHRLEVIREEMKQEQVEIERIQQTVEETRAAGLKLKKEVDKRTQILAMLPKADDHIARLESICKENESKLAELTQEWESHRAPLLQEENALISMKSDRKARCRLLLSEMKVFRVEMKEMAATIQAKMEATEELEKAYTSLSSHVSRSSYTNRIMDITKQLHKQKDEIRKIIEDIKAIQKQLNISSEKLKRSEAVADEKLFTAASKHTKGGSSHNNPYIECYRKFAEVRELFEELLLIVGDVGKKENTARDLENWIAQLQSRDNSAQLERVLTDLQSIKQENTALSEQLKRMRQASTPVE